MNVFEIFESELDFWGNLFSDLDPKILFLFRTYLQ